MRELQFHLIGQPWHVERTCHADRVSWVSLIRLKMRGDTLRERVRDDLTVSFDHLDPLRWEAPQQAGARLVAQPMRTSPTQKRSVR